MKKFKLDQEESKKNISAEIPRKKLKKSKVIIICLGLGLVCVSVVGITKGIEFFTDIHYRDYDDKSTKSFVEMIDENKDETNFDELIKIANEQQQLDENDGLLERIDRLEKQINLTKSLTNLNLDVYNKNLNSCDISKYSLEDINLLIDKFYKMKDSVDLKTPNKETREFYEIVSILTTYSNNLDHKVQLSALDDINKIADLLIKAKIMQELDLTDDEYANVTTNTENYKNKIVVTYKQPITGKVYELKVSYFTLMDRLMDAINDLKNLLVVKKNDLGDDVPINYQKVLEKEEEIVNIIKNIFESEFTIESGKVSQLDTKKLVKDMSN